MGTKVHEAMRDDLDQDEFTETELEILELLDDGRGTPSYLASEIDVTAEYVRGRLGELERLGLVEKVHRGLYELADRDE
jgi:Mn-dependent DtxR family transcriptional regulator